MDIAFLSPILTPFQNAIAFILARSVETLSSLGMDPGRPATWMLAIVALVLIVRIALLPLTIHQVRLARVNAAMAPDLAKLRAKYRGRTDAASRQAMAKETMELRTRHGAKGMGCLPLLAQAPVFFALYSVLRSVASGIPVGALTSDLISQASASTLFGAHLADTIVTVPTVAGGVLIGAILALAAGATLATQLLTRRLGTVPGTDPDDPTARAMSAMLYLAPVGLLFSGAFLPLGVVVYWLASNVWTLGQQMVTISLAPMPGSRAHQRRTERAQRADHARRRRAEA